MASQKAPAPAPVQRCPSNLIALKDLVRKEIVSNGFAISRKDQIQVKAQSGVVYPVAGMPAVLESWQPIATSGNNSDCLVHTILTQLSPHFRGLGESNKNAIATWFRTVVLTTLPDIMRNDASMNRLRTPGVFLENFEIRAISDYWCINFLVLAIEGPPSHINKGYLGDQLYANNGDPVYIIANNGLVHFQPLRSPTRSYTLPWDQALTIAEPQMIDGQPIPADLNCVYEEGDIVVYRNNPTGPRFTVTGRVFPGNDGRQDCTHVRLNDEIGNDVGNVEVGLVMRAPVNNPMRDTSSQGSVVKPRGSPTGPIRRTFARPAPAPAPAPAPTPAPVPEVESEVESEVEPEVEPPPARRRRRRSAREVEEAPAPVNFGIGDSCKNLVAYHLGNKTNTTISLAVYNDLILMANELGMTAEEINECLRSKRIKVSAPETGYANKVLNEAVTLAERKPLSPPPAPAAVPPPPPPPPPPKFDPEQLKRAGKVLADGQVLRLKPNTLGRASMMDQALKLTSRADDLYETIQTEKSDLEFELAGKDPDLKFGGGGSLDMFQSQNEKINTCISTHKSTILERYEKDLAEIEKRQKEVAEKAYEVSKPNENKGDKGTNFESMNKEQLIAKKTELNFKKNELERKPKTSGIEGEIKGIQRKIDRINEILKTKPGGGGKRNVTLRRPRRYE